MYPKKCFAGEDSNFETKPMGTKRSNSKIQPYNDNYIELQNIEVGSEDGSPKTISHEAQVDAKEVSSLRNQQQRSNVNLKRFILLLFVLSLVALVQNLTSSLSCTGDSLTDCYPQFTLRVKERSFESNSLLSGIREGLRTISYFAKDLSVNLNGKTNVFTDRPRHLDIIDTFSDHNIYKFNFNGYCRENTIYNNEYCVYSNGLDIFSSLIKDIGLQLGNVSKVENPLELGESLVTTYAEALVDLNELYEKGERSEPGFENLDMASLGLIHKIRYLETFATTMSLCSLVSIIVSILLVLHNSTIVLSFTCANKFCNYIQSNLFVHLIVNLTLIVIHLVSNIILVVCETYFYEMLAHFLNQIDIAVVNTGSGYNMLIANIGVLSAMMVLVSIVLSKKWVSKPRH